jgi:hypothetical protein
MCRRMHLAWLVAWLMTGASAHEQHNTVTSANVTYYVSADLNSPLGSGYPAYSPEISFDADFEFRITHAAGVATQSYSVNWTTYNGGMTYGNQVGGDFDVYEVQPDTNSGLITENAHTDAIGVAPDEHNADAIVKIRKTGGVDEPVQAQQWDGHIFSAS